MKYLGIDYGEKRVGIAISDIEGKLAFPKIVLENNANLILVISEICQKEGAEAIVIGESKDYQGGDNKISPKIISFKRDLSAVVKLLIFLEPEFMTSMQVEKTFGKTEMLDASAASIILQTFLDKEKVRKEKKNQKVNSEDSPLKSRGETSKFTGKISYDDFKKVEIKIGKILSAEKITGSDKLLKLSVDFAESMPRQIVSGISKYFSDTKNLVGKKCAFVTNLEPKPLMGMESNGMILAVGGGEEPFSLFEVRDEIQTGVKAK